MIVFHISAKTKDLLLNHKTHPSQVQDLQSTSYKQMFFSASQNTNEESIFIWDLYQKRSVKITDEKTADIPEGKISFKNDDAEILAFSWLKDTCKLVSLVNLKSKEESFLCNSTIGLIESRFAQQQGKEEFQTQQTNDSEKFHLQINLNKIDKHTQVEKLPVNICAFYADPQNRNRVFGMSQFTQVLMDLKDRNNVKHFGSVNEEWTRLPKSESNLFHIDYNGQNDVIFAKSDAVLVYDIRKVS